MLREMHRLSANRLTDQQSADLHELNIGRYRVSSVIIIGSRSVGELLSSVDNLCLGNKALDRLVNASFQVAM